MIQFTIGPMNGDSIDLQIPQEGTVRDILMKYVGALDLSSEEARKCRLIFNSTLLRTRRSVREIDLVTGSHILVKFKDEDEVNSESSEQEEAIEGRARRGMRYLQKRGDAFERSAFDLEGEDGTCRIAGFHDSFKEVTKGLDRNMPLLYLLEIDLQEITLNTELYLPDIEVFGVVVNMKEAPERCTLEVLGVGLDESCVETSMKDLIAEGSLALIKNMWQRLDKDHKRKYLTNVLQRQTSWRIYKPFNVPHDIAGDIEDIANPDLRALLFDDTETYNTLCEKPRVDFNFKYVPGPAGCGKTHYMLNTIENNKDSRFAIVVHSNSNVEELFFKMKDREVITSRKAYFLAKTLLKEKIPSNWIAMQSENMKEDRLRAIVRLNGILVVGTVKKIDDLRRRCKDLGLSLRFDHILHDDFVRHSWLELLVAAKVADRPCAYKAFGDRMQMKNSVVQDLFQPPYTTSQDFIENYQASLDIQKDMWKRFDEYIEYKRKQSPDEKKKVNVNLKQSLHISEKLYRNHRSHPDIVVKCSNAFYNSNMQPACDEECNYLWKEPDNFPLKELRHRVIFVHVDSRNDAKQSKRGAWCNDAELLQAQNLQMALMDLGIEKEDILLLAAYSKQADRIKGLSVPASQGSERRVVIYTMTCYGKAISSSGRQSLRDDFVNTAVTRGQSLVFIVGDTNAVRSHISLNYGTRQLLNSCPVVPAERLLVYLSLPVDCARLNNALDNEFMPDKKKRGHPTKSERKQNKRQNLGNYKHN